MPDFLKNVQVNKDVSGIKKIYTKTLLSVFSLLFFILYVVSVAVVIMFLTSALHIINPELFRFQRFDLLTGGITVFILVVSIRTFPKFFRKYCSFLHHFFRRNGP